MKFYQEITLLPDTEITPGFLWQKIYQQVHIALVENKIAENQSAIAVSFPEYGSKGFPLGNKLRLLAQTQVQLEQLAIAKWLDKISDYCHIKSIKPVPDQIENYVCFKRKQFKSPARLLADIERRAKFQSKNERRDVNEVKQQLLQTAQKYEPTSKLPFIRLISQSSKPDVSVSEKDRFLLFIEMEEKETEIIGEFNCYGLSKRDRDKQATVPWF